MTAFISKPDLSPAPDVDPNILLLRPGELRTYCRGWYILDSRELGVPCEFGDSPHRPVVDEVVARKPK